MKKLSISSSLVLLVFLMSCSTSMKYTWTKENYQGRTYKKVLVIAEGATYKARTNMEDAIVAELAKEGITATTSLTTFPPNGNNHELSEDEIENKIIEGGYDGVLVTSLVDAKTRDVREGGGSYYQPVRVGYGRRVRTGYVHMQEPEYYRQEKTFVLETQFYDLVDNTTEDAVVWSGQSEITDPSSVGSASKKHSKKLVKTLIESGLVQ